MVMVVNEFDLSVGSMASLGGVMAALMAVAGIPVGAASCSRYWCAWLLDD